MYYAGRPYYPPPYRPVYAPYYRPVTGYYPPANCHWSQYNRSVNVNNNYYGRFHNTNVSGGLSATAAQPNWKGQNISEARPGQPSQQGSWPTVLPERKIASTGVRIRALRTARLDHSLPTRLQRGMVVLRAPHLITATTTAS